MLILQTSFTLVLGGGVIWTTQSVFIKRFHEAKVRKWHHVMTTKHILPFPQKWIEIRRCHMGAGGHENFGLMGRWNCNIIIWCNLYTLLSKLVILFVLTPPAEQPYVNSNWSRDREVLLSFERSASNRTKAIPLSCTFFCCCTLSWFAHQL